MRFLFGLRKDVVSFSDGTWYHIDSERKGGGDVHRILIVEDDQALCQGIALALDNGEDRLTACHSLAEARAMRAETGFDLAILDVNLTDGSGLDLLRDIRRTSSLPVLLLTANDLETDVVTGLELGADDYVTKPFSLMILRARVRALLRRQRPGAVTVGPFVFDFEAMTFTRDGRPVELSRTEQRLLRALVENRGHTVTREALLERLWADGADFVEENALSVTVRRLRAKLENDPSHPRYIRTVYGLGYTWADAP